MSLHAIGYENDLATYVGIFRRLQIFVSRVVHDVCRNSRVGGGYGFAQRGNVELQITVTAHDRIGTDTFPAVHLKFLNPDLVETERLELSDSPVPRLSIPGGTGQPLRRNGDKFLENLICLVSVQRGITKSGSRRQLPRGEVLVSFIRLLCVG